jgi:hypothetical protein
VRNGTLNISVTCPEPFQVNSAMRCVCGLGTYYETSGTGYYSLCVSCPLGTFKNQLRATLVGDSCTPCAAVLPSGTTLSPGAASASECVCAPGRYYFNGTCSRCTDGMVCDAVDTHLESVELQAGYWRTGPRSADVLSCQNSHCVGVDVTYCQQGFTGPLCTLCQPGYLKTITGYCTPCRDSTSYPYTVTLIVVLGLLVLYGLTRVSGWRRFVQWVLDHAEVMWQHAKILLAFAQIVSGFATVLSVQYPANLTQLMLSAQVLNFGLGDILTVDCTLQVNFYGKLLGYTLGPPAAMLLGALVCWALCRNVPAGDSRRGAAWGSYRRGVLVFLYVAFPSISAKIFQTFSCQSFDDGRVLLKTDYRCVTQHITQPGDLAG